jgi:hypothetical protein
MTIKTYRINNDYLPMLCCDECGEPITDTGMALAIWINKNDDLEAPVEVFVVHKGNCDRSKSKKLRSSYGPEQHEVSEELNRHIVKLLENTNMVKVESVKGDEVKYDTRVLDRAFKINERALTAR